MSIDTSHTFKHWWQTSCPTWSICSTWAFNRSHTATQWWHSNMGGLMFSTMLKDTWACRLHWNSNLPLCGWSHCPEPTATHARAMHQSTHCTTFVVQHRNREWNWLSNETRATVTAQSPNLSCSLWQPPLSPQELKVCQWLKLTRSQTSLKMWKQLQNKNWKQPAGKLFVTSTSSAMLNWKEERWEFNPW